MDANTLFTDKIGMEIFDFKIVRRFRHGKRFNFNRLYYTICTIRKQHFIPKLKILSRYPLFG